MANQEKPVFTKGYDIQGNSVFRQLCHWFRIKTQIMGNYDSGPGLLCLLRLQLLHYFGKPIFAAKIWLNNQYALKARVRGLIAKLKQKTKREAESE